jgi:hypothetical protein
MRTRVIQDEPRPTDAVPPVPEAAQDDGDQAVPGEPQAPDQAAKGDKP